MSSSLYPAIAIVGPTGSGKSQLALALARDHHGEIVSCDALQVYRHMDIGTAKPSVEDRAAVAHHLLDILDPGQEFSAGEYQRAARKALAEIRSREHVPFVVGGTGFYLRSLIDGLFEGPQGSPELRIRMRRIIRRRGVRSLHHALARVDPESASRISQADASRILRAYEIYLMTGKPISWWQRRPTERLEVFRWLKLGIAWPRETLYRRINDRVRLMIEEGFVEEVRALLNRCSPKSPAFKAIGYSQLAHYLEGKQSLDAAVEEIQQATRRYAKRQLTWFRAEKEVLWLDAEKGWPSLESSARDKVQEFLVAVQEE